MASHRVKYCLNASPWGRIFNPGFFIYRSNPTIRSLPGSLDSIILWIKEHPRKNYNLIGLLINSVQKISPFAALKNCFFFFHYDGGRISGFIMEYEAPVSKKAATLIGLAYFEGMTFILIIGVFCTKLTAFIWNAWHYSESESESVWLWSVSESES